MFIVPTTLATTFVDPTLVWKVSLDWLAGELAEVGSICCVAAALVLLALHNSIIFCNAHKLHCSGELDIAAHFQHCFQQTICLFNFCLEGEIVLIGRWVCRGWIHLLSGGFPSFYSLCTTRLYPVVMLVGLFGHVNLTLQRTFSPSPTSDTPLCVLDKGSGLLFCLKSACLSQCHQLRWPSWQFAWLWIRRMSYSGLSLQQTTCFC